MNNKTMKHTDHKLPFRLSSIIIVTDIIMLIIAFKLSCLLSAQFYAFFPEYFDYNPVICEKLRIYGYAILSFVLLIAFYSKGLYSNRVPWWGKVRYILHACLYAVFFDTFLYFALSYNNPYALVPFYWIISFFFLLIGRRISLFLVSLSPSWKLPVVLMGDRQMIIDTMYAFYADGQTGYEVKAIFLWEETKEPFSLDFIPKAHPHIDLIQGRDDYDNFIRENPQYFYIIALDNFRAQYRDRLMVALENTPTQYAIIPPITRLSLHGMDPHYFFGNDIMLLYKRKKFKARVGRLLKRLMDLAASFCALIPLGLITVIVIIMKKIEGANTSIFYGGKRVGKNGELFNCWKFCTMKSNGDEILRNLLRDDENARIEWNTFQKLKNDPRIDSSISKILRKTSLDELPQLWNVFVGDMSLVGPRPILPDQVGDYGPMIEHYHQMRPGLTGLWQVSGRNETTFQRRVYWDDWYIRNWTLWHDIVILFKTVKVLLTGSGAY